MNANGGPGQVQNGGVRSEGFKQQRTSRPGNNRNNNRQPLLKQRGVRRAEPDNLNLSDDYFEFTYRFEIELTFHTSRKQLQEELNRYYGVNFDEEPQDLDDIVPEYVNSTNTANRITDFATSLLPHYLDNNGGELTEKTISGFMELIGGGIDEGFRQARGILTSDWKVMNDPLDNLINRTYNKVQENLAEFRDQLLEKIEEDQETTKTDK